MTGVSIGLGSNIDPEANLRHAADELRKFWPEIRFSSAYRSAPVERTDQPEFLNAVARIETEERAEEILSKLQAIEKRLKKNPPFRFGPRTIDLDLLLYGDEVIDQPGLKVPHPKMHERRFVLEPLMEVLDGNTEHPSLKQPFPMLLDALTGQDCTKVPVQL